MKPQTVLLAASFFVTGFAFAQSQVGANEIIAKINKGEAVNYQNTRITGDLDLTHLSNQTFKLQNHNKVADTIFINSVAAPVNFTNCTFEGKVIGYYNPDNGKEVEINRVSRIYNTNFEKAVAFKNCTFEKEVNFKYSEFKEAASFSGSKFQDLAFFKYTDFTKGPDFSQAQFKDLSFKYVKFPGEASFAGARFAGDTDFKYAEFKEGVNFQKANFEGFANFKYAKLSNPNLKEAVFTSTGDFKYTTVNNRKMALTALTDNSRLQ